MKNHRLMVVGSIYRREKKIPYIRLSGNWLAENGFKIGRKLHVYVKPGSLVIKLIIPEDE